MPALNVLVDTSVWSLAFRRKPKHLNARERRLVGELADLVREGRARIIGLVRQEVLSGIKTHAQLKKLRRTLAAFSDIPIDTGDYEAAAEGSNACLAQGIAFSVVDMLICAAARRPGMSVFTIDPDFETYAQILALKLHSVPRVDA
jgi:hypothetical protein